jgi:hypothetical protein
MRHNKFKISPNFDDILGQKTKDHESFGILSKVLDAMPEPQNSKPKIQEKNTTKTSTQALSSLQRYINKGYPFELDFLSTHNSRILNKLIKASQVFIINEAQRFSYGLRKKQYLGYVDLLIERFLEVDWNRLALNEIKNKFLGLEKRFFYLLNRIKCNLQICVYCGAALTRQTVNSVCFENSKSGEDSVIIKELFEDYIDAVMNQEELRDKVGFIKVFF